MTGTARTAAALVALTLLVAGCAAGPRQELAPGDVPLVYDLEQVKAEAHAALAAAKPPPPGAKLVHEQPKGMTTAAPIPPDGPRDRGEEVIDFVLETAVDAATLAILCGIGSCGAESFR